MNLEPYYTFLTETAYLAGRLTLGYFRTGLRPEFKADDTPVTRADREAEALIRSRIETQYPTHAIVGEEYGEKAGGDFRWFIDPIDGTKSFARGVPLYGVLIGLEIAGRVEAGAAYFPALDEMISAASGLGCWWNGRRARVNDEARLDRATVAFTDPAVFARQGRAAAWERLQNAVYYRAGWSDSYAYALAATGRVEIALDPVMNTWDCGPFPPIFREAGGFFGDWQGNETIYSRTALATNAALCKEVLALLNAD